MVWHFRNLLHRLGKSESTSEKLWLSSHNSPYTASGDLLFFDTGHVVLDRFHR